MNWQRLALVAAILLLTPLITECGDVTPSPTVAALIKYQPPQHVTVLARETALRSAPALDAAIVSLLKEGDVVAKLEKQGPWVRVRADAGEGWMLEEVLDERTVTPVVRIEATPTSTQPSKTPTPTPASVPTPNAVVTAKSLNVRAGPGVSFARVGFVYRNDPLIVTDYAGECIWLHVITPSKIEGWVSADYVRLNIPCTQIAGGATAPGSTPTTEASSVPTKRPSPTVRTAPASTATPRPASTSALTPLPSPTSKATLLPAPTPTPLPQPSATPSPRPTPVPQPTPTPTPIPQPTPTPTQPPEISPTPPPVIVTPDPTQPSIIILPTNQIIIKPTLIRVTPIWP